MEIELGQELGDVRVHRDSPAERAAAAANATAFTVGNHVVFGRGAYDPGSARGRKVLAHELVHVLQRSPAGSLGVVPPGAQAEQQAARGVAGASAAGGLARITERDVTQLNDAELESEYGLVQEWLAEHPTGADHDAGMQYMQEIEQEVATRTASAATAQPATPGASEETPSGEQLSSQPRNYQSMSDEELSGLARQGDTDAASEIFARGRATPGYQEPAPGSEELGSDVDPEFIGPERESYQSGRTDLNEGDIDTYGSFNTAARGGDELAGHELLQNAFLRVTGQVARRGTGPVSRGNPSLAVGDDLHVRIGAAQRRLGLFDRTRLATMTDEEVIAANVQALQEAGVEQSQIQMMTREALHYAAELRAGQSLPPEATYTPGEQTVAPEPTVAPETPGVPEPTGTPEQTFTPPEPTTSAPEGEMPVPEGEGPTGGSGAGGVMLGVGAPIVLGVVHDAAVQAIRDERGYAPVGVLAYAHEGFFSRVARAFTGAAVEEATADLPSRFNIPVFRANVRSRAQAVPVGGTLLVLWQVPMPAGGGIHEVQNFVTLYRREAADAWRLVPNAQAPDDLDTEHALVGLLMPVISATQAAVITPDLGRIVGTASDRDVAAMLHIPAR